MIRPTSRQLKKLSGIIVSYCADFGTGQIEEKHQTTTSRHAFGIRACLVEGPQNDRNRQTILVGQSVTFDVINGGSVTCVTNMDGGPIKAGRLAVSGEAALAAWAAKSSRQRNRRGGWSIKDNGRRQDDGSTDPLRTYSADSIPMDP